MSGTRPPPERTDIPEFKDIKARLFSLGYRVISTLKVARYIRDWWIVEVIKREGDGESPVLKRVRCMPGVGWEVEDLPRKDALRLLVARQRNISRRAA